MGSPPLHPKQRVRVCSPNYLSVSVSSFNKTTMSFLFALLTVSSFFNLIPAPVSGDPVYEDGYTVTTVLNGDKLPDPVNPYSVLPQPGASSDFIVLDSAKSTFYTLSFSSTQEPLSKRLSGKDSRGYLDGDLGSAVFNNPRSFAVDYSGNVYVADKHNNVIRKITKSGVTTIAGYPEVTGHIDGPGRNASFSPDFAVTFVPESCALLISDHQYRLLRQINLKVEDCTRGSKSVLGTPFAWALGFGLLLFGIIIGFLLHAYVMPRDGFGPLLRSEIWKHSLLCLGTQVQMFCFVVRNAVVNLKLYSLLRRLLKLSLSHISLMFGINIIQSRNSSEKPVSLLDIDDLNSNEELNSKAVDDQLKDLLNLNSSSSSNYDEKIILQEDTRVSPGSKGKIDRLIIANITGFMEQSSRTSSTESSDINLGLVRRR